MTFTVHEKGKRPRAWCVECGKPHPAKDCRRRKVDPWARAVDRFTRFADAHNEAVRRNA